MERNTKREILDEALNLFSTEGYEATSVSQIAQAVGIRKSSLYSHFASKQEILDALIKDVFIGYERRSIFSKTADAQKENGEKANGENSGDEQPVNAVGRIDDCEGAIKVILGHVKYILHDERIRKSRTFLTIEQFRNKELGELLTRLNYTAVTEFFTESVRSLIRCGKLKDGDPEIMACELCLPVSVWINLCDREPNREDEITRLIERHIREFFKIYAKGEE